MNSMKTKSNSAADRADIRTTVSLAQVIWDKAQTQMIRGGYNKNFSSFVSDLIRRHDEQENIADLVRDLDARRHDKQEKIAALVRNLDVKISSLRK